MFHYTPFIIYVHLCIYIRVDWLIALSLMAPTLGRTELITCIWKIPGEGLQNLPRVMGGKPGLASELQRKIKGGWRNTWECDESRLWLNTSSHWLKTEREREVCMRLGLGELGHRTIQKVWKSTCAGSFCRTMRRQRKEEQQGLFPVL